MFQIHRLVSTKPILGDNPLEIEAEFTIELWFGEDDGEEGRLVFRGLITRINSRCIPFAIFISKIIYFKMILKLDQIRIIQNLYFIKKISHFSPFFWFRSGVNSQAAYSAKTDRP